MADLENAVIEAEHAELGGCDCRYGEHDTDVQNLLYIRDPGGQRKTLFCDLQANKDLWQR